MRLVGFAAELCDSLTDGGAQPSVGGLKRFRQRPETKPGRGSVSGLWKTMERGRRKT